MTAYEQGFMEKCAEFGVDPDELVKEAARGEMAAKMLQRFKNFMGGSTNLLDDYRLADAVNAPGVPGSNNLSDLIRGLLGGSDDVQKALADKGGVFQSQLARAAKESKRLANRDIWNVEPRIDRLFTDPSGVSSRMADDLAALGKSV